jgi:predicted ATPase
MLTKVTIHDPRLRLDVQLENLGPIVALIGRNGAGKSITLQAIERVAKSAVSANPMRTAGPSPLPSAKLEFRTEERSFRYSFGAKIYRAMRGASEALEEEVAGVWREVVKRDGESVAIEGRESIKIGLFSAVLPAIATLLPADDPVVQTIKPAIRFLAGIHYYPIDEPAAGVPSAGPIGASQYNAWSAQYESTGVPVESIPFRVLYMDEKMKEDFDVLKQLLDIRGLGLVNQVFINKAQPREGGSGGESYYYFVLFDPSRGVSGPPWPVPYENLSLGTRRLVRILTSMLFDKSAVMLLEQPEDGLHQGLTGKLIGLMRENAEPAQLIMSSHSSVLLNRLNPDEVHIVSLRNGLTTARKLTAEELQVATKFMSDEGPLYDFLETVQEE